MKLICYPTSGEPPRIRPAPAQRAWMEETPSSFAIRCLPLNIANAHGWEILSPCTFTATWSGGTGKEAIRIESTYPASTWPLSHFGSGVLTFHVTGLFRTEPGVNLWCSGPVNRPKDGIQPLTGIIETDWAPYTFTMNWLFTRANQPVFFAENEPFCFIFPLQRDLVDAVEPEFRDMSEDPDLVRDFKAWSEGRLSFNRELGVEGSPARKDKWQKTYYRGLRPSGDAGVGDHKIKMRVRGFERRGGDK